MSLAIVYTRARLGMDAPLVEVETHLTGGLPSLHIVGLPEAAVKESKDRVRSAILNSHFEFPARRITINLAPADLPKDGGRYDLAIALGILAASGQLPKQQLSRYEVLGELALSGQLRDIPASLPAAMAAAKNGRALLLPKQNAKEAALCQAADIFAASSLLEACAHLNGNALISKQEPNSTPVVSANYSDLQEVKGQAQAKRALEIAAAGTHNLLLFGPPGTGKTMLAQRLAGILPPLNDQQAIEVASVHSLLGRLDLNRWRQRPFRAPHHTASAIAMVGGGSQPKPGEISLAHHGVLFLDELPEFPRQVLEVLREPLENGEIRISRAKAQLEFPARFQLVAAMNPCPCGYFGQHGPQQQACRCTPNQVRRYRDKISGPLLDRIDMHLPVNAINPEQLSQLPAGESSQQVQQRVSQAWDIQQQRQSISNAQLSNKQLDQFCGLDSAAENILRQALQKFGLSARAYHRIIKVARTIADLAQCQDIHSNHIAEAISYRNLDRPLS